MSPTEYYNPSETQYERIPHELRQLNQWVTWRCKPPAKPGEKPRKVPTIAGTSRQASSTDPATWRTYAEAVAAVERGTADGIGIVVTDDDPITGVDLDNCRDAETGEIAPWAMEIIERFNTYTESSPTGTGVHIIGRGVKPGTDCRKSAQIECYDHARYFTMTGTPLPGYETVRNCQRALTAWHRETWPAKPETPRAEPAPALDLDDERIIDLARRSANGTKFSDLYNGGLSGHPSPSEARYALMGILNFYTDDAEQMERILQTSGQWTAKCEARPELVRAEIAAQIADYTGPRYDPTWGKHATSARTNTVGGGPDRLSCNEVRAQLVTLQEENAELRERVASQQQMIRYERGLRKDIERIAAAGEIEAGPRLTSIALYCELNTKMERGQKPDDRGWQIPAVWLARRSGQTAQTVNRHLQVLSRKEIITRDVVNLTKGEDAVDNDTGEIFTVDVPRKVGFISSSPEAIVTNLAEYRRDAEADKVKHGGKADRNVCADHPNAGTVKRWTLHCRVCDKQLDEGTEYLKPSATVPTTHDDDADDLAATGTDDGIRMMDTPSPTVSVPLDIRTMDTPSPASTGTTIMDTPTSISADDDVPHRVRRCRCSAMLVSGEQQCPACAETYRRRAEARADREKSRPRILHGRICAEHKCQQPTGSPDVLYCRDHDGTTTHPPPSGVSHDDVLDAYWRGAD